MSAAFIDERWQLAILAAGLLSDDPHAAGALERASSDFGHFEGLPPLLELLDDGRKARLTNAISYIGTDGNAWPVPPSTVVDGASIPRPFWTIIGGPFEGRYRNASIVHDCYCDTRSRSWRETHRMFHSAMRCSGVSAAKAKIMFYAVYRFGPRWPEAGGALEAFGAPAQLETADPLTFVSDAQSISLHDPSLEEIESLVDARTVQEMGRGVLETMEAPTVDQRVKRLVVTGGRGTAEDLLAVTHAAANLPDFVLGRFESKAIRIVACRDSVTDFETRLRGVTPRGWEGTGRTWDDVPGTYFSDRKCVVIATVGSGGSRIVPTKASGKHGSADLVVHESLHGYDYSGRHEVLSDVRFIAARNADHAKLGAYERQVGRAGLEETFAETGARFAGENAALAADWPSLFSYWEDGISQFSTEAPALETIVDESSIGTARRLGDGIIELDLRAEDDCGAIGHALLRIQPDDPHYEAISTHIARSESTEHPGDTQVLFRAMDRE